MAQQYSLKSGLKRFDENGEHVVTSELEQLHEMDTFVPLDANKPTKKDKADAPVPLMSLT